MAAKTDTGAEPPDVPEIVPLLLSQARRYMAQGAVALNLDHRCPPNSECDRLGGCRAYVREAECYSALSVALRCMEKHGRHDHAQRGSCNADPT